MHGYEMIKEIEERSEGAWTPSAGSIYPMLQLLEDEGLIRGEEADGKRRFTLTDAGRTEQDEKSGDVTPWDAVRAGVPTGHLQLRGSIGQLLSAVKAVAAGGDEEQQKQVSELLDETRRKVYAILAEGPADETPTRTSRRTRGRLDSARGCASRPGPPEGPGSREVRFPKRTHTYGDTYLRLSSLW